jgi:23S rRNA (uracil1939-C5)-methyltransferase
MIPHSDAVECLVTLQRGAAPPPDVIYEDAQLIAVVKSGYEALDNDPSSLLARVRALSGASAAIPLSAAHLDRDASGICVFARSPALMPELGLTHTFVALARGITHKKGRIRRPVREGRRTVQAATRYQRDAVHGGHSLLSVTPEPGNGPYIRQHLASVGHAVLGDTRFGDPASNTFFEHRHGLDRSFLHRSALTLSSANGAVTLAAPLPGELVAVLASLSDQPTARG